MQCLGGEYGLCLCSCMGCNCTENFTSSQFPWNKKHQNIDFALEGAYILFITVKEMIENVCLLFITNNSYSIMTDDWNC